MGKYKPKRQRRKAAGRARRNANRSALHEAMRRMIRKGKK